MVNRAMALDDAMLCPHHGRDVRLVLSTLHSDSSLSERLTALYECPECGYQRRLPLEPAAEPEIVAEVA